jgi:hypothetical protein
MFGVAERNPRLTKYRDGLETIINRAMEFVQDASISASENRFSISTDMIGELQEQPLTPSSLDPMKMLDLQSLPPDIAQSLGLASFEPQVPFPSFAGLSSNFGYQTVDFPEEHSLCGAFSEEFWAADAFNMPMLDGFKWRI